jgi:uncharacterized protein YdaU (DUF1376 family)
MNYYEHHLGDWAAATGHLSWDEDMAYTRLLRAYYHAEKAIPEGQQYRLSKASTPTQRKAVEAVLAEFFELRDGSFFQKRAEEELARFKDKQAKAKASANARWSQSERNANASPNAMRTHSEGNALQTPDTRHQSKEEGIKGERQRGARLPSDWCLPDEWASWAKDERPDLDPSVTASKFRDYWAAKPGAAGRKLDWLATWRNWVREERGSPPLRVVAGAVPAWKAEQQARMAEFAGPAAAKPSTQPKEIVDVTARIVG